MGISKRMLIGSVITGALYFVLGELLYRTLPGNIHTAFLIGLYFMGLMVLIIIGINIIGATMSRSIGAYRDITLRCMVLCLAILVAGIIFEVLYEVGFRQKITDPTSYIFAIDNSGSMINNDPDNKRYDAIQAALNNKSQDFSFAVYAFAGSSRVLRHMGPVSQGTGFDVEKPNGGTGIKTVIADMYADIDSGKMDPGANGKVLLFTDGYATDLVPFLGKAGLNRILDRYSKKGISISTVGLGSPDDELMEMIAKKTGGIYVRVEAVEQLEDAMKEAIESSSSRNLLDYRNRVRFDFLYMMVRFAAVLCLGLLLGLVKMYICEPFLDTRLLWVTSVICSLAAAACMEFGMNMFGMLPQLMRLLMCMLLAAVTLKTKEPSVMDCQDRYRHY